MKKLFSYIFIITIVMTFLTGAASAETLYNLDDIQLFILHHDPWTSGEQHVSITGKIAEITVSDFWGYIYRVEVEDGTAAYYMGYDKPCFIVVTDEVFKVGNVITVDGIINTLYSSYMVPFITDQSIKLTYPGQN